MILSNRENFVYSHFISKCLAFIRYRYLADELR